MLACQGCDVVVLIHAAPPFPTCLANFLQAASMSAQTGCATGAGLLPVLRLCLST